MKLYQNRTLEKILAQAVTHPDAIALEESSGHKITYAQLASQVDALAANLVKRGVKKRDRALVLVRPCLTVFVLALALERAGASIVLADPGMGNEIFASRVRLANPQWIFAETLLLAAQWSARVRRMLRARGIEIPALNALSDAQIVNVGPRLPFLNAAFTLPNLNSQLAVNDTEQEMFAPDDECFIIFTSGTTDMPRGIIHSMASMDYTIEMLGEHMHVAPTDILYASALHFVTPALCAGARVILPPLKFKPEEFLAHLEKYRATVTYANPGDLMQVISHCEATKTQLPETLECLVLGSAPISVTLMRRLSIILPAHTRVREVYGMTEILPVTEISLAEKLAYDRGGNPVGHPLPGIQIAITQENEILVRGPNLFKGILGNPAPPPTEHLTGDTGFLDAKMGLVLTGRKKDMLLKQGHNIYPGLFEPTIEKIQGVRACAIIGLPDRDTLEEKVILVVEPEPTVEPTTLIRTLRRELVEGTHSIDTYAQPDRIICMTLPRAGRSNKIDKKKLREIFANEAAQ